MVALWILLLCVRLSYEGSSPMPWRHRAEKAENVGIESSGLAAGTQLEEGNRGLGKEFKRIKSEFSFQNSWNRGHLNA